MFWGVKSLGLTKLGILKTNNKRTQYLLNEQASPLCVAPIGHYIYISCESAAEYQPISN